MTPTRIVITDPAAAARFASRIRPGRPATGRTPVSGPENAPQTPEPPTKENQVPTAAIYHRPTYAIHKRERRNAYGGQTVFIVLITDTAPIEVTVYHPEFEDHAGTPVYRGARINWPGTESTKLARGMADALTLAADEADRLNREAAESWAANYFNDREPGDVTEGEFQQRVALILEEMT